MDMKLGNTSSLPGSFPSWDFVVDGSGNVPIIYGDEESLQQATAAAYTIKSAIPQLPDVGVPWLEALSGDIDFGTLDSAISTELFNSGNSIYYQKYDIVNQDQLAVEINKRTVQ